MEIYETLGLLRALSEAMKPPKRDWNEILFHVFIALTFVFAVAGIVLLIKGV